jgi:hypothetical protein
MKTLWWLWIGLAVLPLSAGELTQGERNRALSELHATRKLFVDAVSGLSEAQWRFKPGPDRWSVAEIAEHVAVTEDLYWNGIQRNVSGDANPEKRAEIEVADEAVIPRMADRTSKREAGEANTPTGRFADAAAVIAAYQASRDRLIDYVRSTKDDLRNHVWPHRAYGPIDGCQWLLLACGHIERHVAQINEVKASEGWPE